MGVLFFERDVTDVDSPHNGFKILVPDRRPFVVRLSPARKFGRANQVRVAVVHAPPEVVIARLDAKTVRWAPKVPGDVDAAARASLHNRAEVEAARRCGCFACLSTFAGHRVTAWVADDDPPTALCPVCGEDAVVPHTDETPAVEAYLAACREAYHAG